jgi:hypothetical protein
MEKETIPSQMRILTKASTQMESQTGTGYIIGLMAVTILGTSREDSNKAKGAGRKALKYLAPQLMNITETTLQTRSMAKGSSTGQVEICIVEITKKMSETATERWYGQTAASTRDSGSEVSSMAMARCLSPMALPRRAISTTTSTSDTSSKARLTMTATLSLRSIRGRNL